MQFIKMHGLGNDYIYINGFQQHVDDPAALARTLADRHFGIGGDGLILVLPPPQGVDAHVRMRMFNADGSEAEMCGNGVRCVCKLAYDHQITPDIRRHNPMRIQTGAGVLELRYQVGPAGRVERITVDMGRPVLDPGRIGVDIAGAERIIDHPAMQLLALAGDRWATSMRNGTVEDAMTCVGMGNPHVVFFCTSVADVPLETVGPAIEHAPIFPHRINVHFAQVHGWGELTMRTWERGSGITLACGTGAAAVCTAAALTGRCGRELLAHLPGGDLELRWDERSDHVFMTGPAVELFTGTWHPR